MKSLIPLYSLGLMVILINCNWSNPNDDIPAPADGKYKLVSAFPNLEFASPIELTSPDDNTDRVFVVGQKGAISVFQNKSDVKTAATFLDITSRLVSGGERGLLGLAFHPNYKSNGYFYVNYTRGNPLETVISRFKVSSSNPNMADPDSELVLLKYSQPYSNHNGGKVAFGNDGYLYIAVGDGGSGGDPQGNAQNRTQLLGKILRIDVNSQGSGMNYAIPNDNPYKGNKEGFREEIYAYGVRNPWRFSFDRTTNTLWAGDVGQNKIEEVDIIEKGGNYGWKVMEANECFNATGCDAKGMIEPIYSYPRTEGASITGGYVCRDKNLSALTGKYIYGDYVSGKIWALSYAGKKAVNNDLIATLSGGLSSFGQDSKNNLYAISYTTGKVYKFALE